MTQFTRYLIDSSYRSGRVHDVCVRTIIDAGYHCQTVRDELEAESDSVLFDGTYQGSDGSGRKWRVRIDP